MIAYETTTRAGRGAGRIGLIVAGALSAALALALLAGGGELVWAHASEQDGHGYYSTGAHQLKKPTYALVSEGLDVGVDGPDYRAEAAVAKEGSDLSRGRWRGRSRPGAGRSA
jgi:hypothetical protein